MTACGKERGQFMRAVYRSPPTNDRVHSAPPGMLVAHCTLHIISAAQ